MKVADIARQLNISYAQAHGALKRSRLPSKPALSVSILKAAGFERLGTWITDAVSGIGLECNAPACKGVYAFVIADEAQYVGVTLRTLHERMGLYRRGDPSQSTNFNMRQRILDLIQSSGRVEIWIATPPDSEWNGLPVDVTAGLEVALIRKYHLPWNRKGI
jgi:hypothetical protein